MALQRTASAPDACPGRAVVQLSRRLVRGRSARRSPFAAAPCTALASCPVVAAACLPQQLALRGGARGQVARARLDSFAAAAATRNRGKGSFAWAALPSLVLRAPGELFTYDTQKLKKDQKKCAGTGGEGARCGSEIGRSEQRFTTHGSDRGAHVALCLASGPQTSVHLSHLSSHLHAWAALPLSGSAPFRAPLAAHRTRPATQYMRCPAT